MVIKARLGDLYYADSSPAVAMAIFLYMKGNARFCGGTRGSLLAAAYLAARHKLARARRLGARLRARARHVRARVIHSSRALVSRVVIPNQRRIARGAGRDQALVALIQRVQLLKRERRERSWGEGAANACALPQPQNVPHTHSSS